ncbi:phage baseplate assembly protein V [Acinetobacter sp. c3-l95]|uniref:phage baseplate assembly protein V n=1 Tax=Acinetobacter sp. c3-l95 TaxID=3342804 RepID=UPI0035BAF79F
MTEIVYGLVENVQYKPLRIQARLPDMDGILSPWALVLTARSQTAKTFDPPVKGEQVALLLYDDGESALCLGSVFSDVDNSPSNKHLFSKVFDDGTRIDYDSDGHELLINAVGNVTVTCSHATINATATIHGDTVIHGDAEITGDALIGGISFLNHQHGGVKRGESKTDTPS